MPFIQSRLLLGLSFSNVVARGCPSRIRAREDLVVELANPILPIDPAAGLIV